MAAKVLFFTVGEKPTTQELARIAALNTAAAAPYEILVRNGAKAGDDFGAGRVEPHDFVTALDPETGIPADFSESDLLALPATLTDGQALEVPVTGTYTDTATVTVEDGAVTAIVLS